MLNFSAIEIRVMGCLLEKQLATPDYYPMTENALVNAANQKSSRDPVMALQAEEVGAALGELSRKEFVEQVKVSGSRSFKFRQQLAQRWRISDVEAETERDVLAVLAVLALRGPQTLGQIRQRTERMFFFPDIEHVQRVVEQLMVETEDRPALVVEDHSIAGRDVRYTHLLGDSATAPMAAPPVVAPSDDTSLIARVEALESEVAALRAMIEELTS